MSTIDFDLTNEEFKDVYDLSIFIGTLSYVHYDTDLADVYIDEVPYADVPIFYHCPNEATTTGGSSAFEAGDEVYVISKKGICPASGADLKIVGRVGGLRECIKNLFLFNDLGDIRENYKISCTYIQQWRPQIFVVWGACYVDDVNDIFSVYEMTFSRVRFYQNLKNGPPSQYVGGYPPPTPANQVFAITFDGTNMILTREKVGDGSKSIIYVMQGFTSILDHQFEVDLHVDEMAFDGTNLILSGTNHAVVGGRGEVWKMSGISAVKDDYIIWPPYADSSRGPQAMEIYRGNLLTWGGWYRTGPRYDYLTLHDGFSDTITDQCAMDPGFLRSYAGMIYPQLPS